MLGALSLKWKWRSGARRRQGHDAPEPRVRRRRARRVGEVLPLLRRRAADHPAAARQVHDRPEDVEPLVDENTIGVAAVLGTTFTGHADDIRGINDLLVPPARREGARRPAARRRASGGFVWPFLYPDSEWDFRLEQVRSINVSGHKFGLVYPASAG
jgi:glutamate decarboxylase